MIEWIVILLALAVILYYRSSRENMTNKDLMDTLKTFGQKGTKPKSKDVHEEPLYGPKSGGLEPTPAPSSGKNSKDGDADSYPDIYGPEITPIPGTKACKKGKHESDCASDDAYQFNPDFDNAFPREDGEPQPFLTDFSSFQH
jgi:hypothetical protein